MASNIAATSFGNVENLTMSSVSDDTKNTGNEALKEALITIGLLTAMFVIIVGNLLVLLAIWRTPALHTHANYLIAHLAANDFLIGVQIAQRLFQEFWPHLLQYHAICRVRLFGRAFGLNGGGLFLIAIGVERWVGIIKPLRYNSWITTKRLHVFAAGIWLTNFLLSLPLLVGPVDWTPRESCEVYLVMPPEYALVSAIYVLVCVAILLPLYVGIIRVARRQQEQMERSLPENIDTNFSRVKLNIRALRAYLMIVLIFAVTWIWMAAILLAKQFNRPETIYEVHKVAQLLLIMNSAANPIIYALRMQSFRQPMRDILCFCAQVRVQPANDAEDGQDVP